MPSKSEHTHRILANLNQAGVTALVDQLAAACVEIENLKAQVASLTPKPAEPAQSPIQALPGVD